MCFLFFLVSPCSISDGSGSVAILVEIKEVLLAVVAFVIGNWGCCLVLLPFSFVDVVMGIAAKVVMATAVEVALVVVVVVASVVVERTQSCTKNNNNGNSDFKAQQYG